MVEFFEMLLELLHGMYEEIVKKTRVQIGFSAILPGLFTIVVTYLLVGSLVERIAGDGWVVDLLSVITVFVLLVLAVKWYINRLRYVFDDGLASESKINLLKFDIAVLVVELAYFATIFTVSSLCAPYDVLGVIIATPVVFYVLHRLFTAWLGRSFDMIK